MNIQPGDLLFVWGQTLIDKGIELVERGGPSHVALFINPTTLAEAQGGRTVGECDLSYYLDMGVKMEVWGDTTLTDDERTRMVEYAKGLYGTPYDYVLIPLELAHFELGAALDWYHEHKHLICSTFVETVAWQVNRIWAPDNVKNPAPVDLMKGGVLVKKGDLTAEEVKVS